MSQYTYLLIDLACISIPFLASFYPKHAFYKEWKYFIPANFLVGLAFLIWDYFFTKAGIWGFNEKYLTGIYIANLPLEEVLFFFSIPYASVFTWFAFKYLIKKNPIKSIEKPLSVFLIIGLFVIGILNVDKSYTSLTFLLTSTYLFISYFLKLEKADIYLSYMAVIPFFFLSNGLLTGSWLEEPIVWYNNLENLGIRMGTIPVEDSIYGLLLIMMNIHLCQFFRKWHLGQLRQATSPERGVKVD